MANRVGGILALIAFAVCLLVGTLEAGNAFSTVVIRALAAMLGLYVIGYLLGVAAEHMMAEHAQTLEKELTAKRMAALTAAAEKNSAAAQEAETDGR